MSTPAALECTPEVSVLLIDGPLQNARTMILDELKKGDQFDVPLPGFHGIASYIVTQTFQSFCSSCERIHRRAIAKHVPYVAR